IPRLSWSRVEGPAPLAVSSFAFSGEHLYLADRVGSRVVHATRDSHGGWQIDSALRVGPMEGPLSLSSDRDGALLIYDSRRVLIRVPTRGGQVSSQLPDLPCNVAEGQLRLTDGARVLLSGTCVDLSGDTVDAVVVSSNDSGHHFTLRRRAPLYARDGSWGSVVYAIRFATSVGDFVEFGTGREPCIVRMTWDKWKPVEDCAVLP